MTSAQSSSQQAEPEVPPSPRSAEPATPTTPQLDRAGSLSEQLGWMRTAEEKEMASWMGQDLAGGTPKSDKSSEGFNV